MPSPKRPSDDEPHRANFINKAPRLATTDNPDDYAGTGAGTLGSTRRKTAASSRTGQACDRCKVRKIRCDARPGGCSPCLQNATECKTTDRITGRATSRGHTENLENENASLRLHLVELENQLREKNILPLPRPNFLQGYPQDSSISPYPPSFSPSTSLFATDASQDAPNNREASRSLPEFQSGRIGENYLGASSINQFMSPITGTSLRLWNKTIDLIDYILPESSAEAQARSYPTFLKRAFEKKTPPIDAPKLPEYDAFRMTAYTYFQFLAAFAPLPHRPDFMRLLNRVYNEDYKPTMAEKVMLHMMVAIVDFQMGTRNNDPPTRKSAIEHYHYSLEFIPALIESHTLEDIQALVMICAQLRSHQRPGAAWMFTNMVLGIAVESGLHRSAGAWEGSTYDSHTIEMRKRTFWTLFLYHVSLSGKLGRPIPLRAEDFDIEIPEPLPDTVDGTSSSDWRSCSFRASIEGFKLLKILLQVYSTIYAIRSPIKAYEMNVRRIEQQLQAFQTQIPPELSCGPETLDTDRVSAIYLRLSLAECQLLLHHPSRQSDVQWENDFNLCLDACKTMLDCSTTLKKLDGFDTTWYYASNFLAAIFTTLFIWTQRADHMTSVEIEKLKTDMNQWTDVMAEVGKVLGSGKRLQSAVRSVIDFSMGFINTRMAQKAAVAANAAIASTETPMPQAPATLQTVYNSPTDGSLNTSNGANPPIKTESAAQPPRHYSGDSSRGLEAPPPPQYAPTSNFSYQEPHNPPIQSYSTAGPEGSFDGSAYAAGETKPSIDSIHAQLNAFPPPQQAHPSNAVNQPVSAQVAQPPTFIGPFSAPVQSQTGYQAGALASQRVGYPATPWLWNGFVTDAAAQMGDGLSAQGFIPPVTASFTNAEPANIGADAVSLYGAPIMQMPAADSQPTWPHSQVNTEATERR